VITKIRIQAKAGAGESVPVLFISAFRDGKNECMGWPLHGFGEILSICRCLREFYKVIVRSELIRDNKVIGELTDFYMGGCSSLCGEHKKGQF